MGNQQAKRRRRAYRRPAIPQEDLWLAQHTFRLRNHLYTLLQRRGGGKFGSIWSCADGTGNYAAVKIFHLNRLQQKLTTTEVIKSFQTEIDLVCRIRETNDCIITILGFDYDAHRNIVLIAMELGDRSLTEYVRSLHESQCKLTENFIPPKNRKEIWIQLVDICQILYQYNIVHRDLKPDSFVYIGNTLKLTDLGIATNDLTKLTSCYTGRQRITVGTRFYSGPECLTGQYLVTLKADIWSLGAILYYLTYGMPPINENHEPPSGRSPTSSLLIENILESCLLKNPNRRPSLQWIQKHPFTNTNALV